MTTVSALASWEAYVDSFDDTTVHLVMVADGNSTEQEFGEFPIGLFSHITLLQGLILKVQVLSDETISIATVPVKRSNDGQELARLIKALR